MQFIDSNGNAFLQPPNLFVLVKRQRPHVNEVIDVTMATPGSDTPTALRAVFAILCRHELLNAPYREIKQAAGIALGAIGWIFLDLDTFWDFSCE